MHWPSHGANPQLLLQQWKLDENEKNYIDFSVNTNPYGPPPGLTEHLQLHMDKCYSYPDHDSKKLTAAIASAYRIRESHILVGNGASQLIYLLAQLFRGQSIGVFEPTFSEYREACIANGCTVYSLPVDDKHDWELRQVNYINWLDKLDVLFLCHPNNPTGKVYNPLILKNLIQQCEQKGVWLVIDEAFHDFVEEGAFFTPEISSYSKVILLRSLTKMYAIPGMRLGYLVAPEPIVDKLHQLQPTWSLNGLAQEAGLYCLEEQAYRKTCSTSIQANKQKVFSYLREMGYEPETSHTNFFLLQDPYHHDTEELFRFLLENGLIVRHTYNFHPLNGRYIRIAVRREEENSLLLDALQRWKQVCLP